MSDFPTAMAAPSPDERLAAMAEVVSAAVRATRPPTRVVDGKTLMVGASSELMVEYLINALALVAVAGDHEVERVVEFLRGAVSSNAGRREQWRQFLSAAIEEVGRAIVADGGAVAHEAART